MIKTKPIAVFFLSVLLWQCGSNAEVKENKTEEIKKKENPENPFVGTWAYSREEQHTDDTMVIYMLNKIPHVCILTYHTKKYGGYDKFVILNQGKNFFLHPLYQDTFFLKDENTIQYRKKTFHNMGLDSFTPSDPEALAKLKARVTDVIE